MRAGRQSCKDGPRQTSYGTRNKSCWDARLVRVFEDAERDRALEVGRLGAKLDLFVVRFFVAVLCEPHRP